ncbi:hypothetical protein Q1695_004352 [Nippostrongylus brasiliensis]|nr:hypothetical protein Q1695_004352 [Nippostrongylus brasiliensis]
MFEGGVLSLCVVRGSAMAHWGSQTFVRHIELSRLQSEVQEVCAKLRDQDAQFKENCRRLAIQRSELQAAIDAAFAEYWRLEEATKDVYDRMLCMRQGHPVPR